MPTLSKSIISLVVCATLLLTSDTSATHLTGSWTTLSPMSTARLSPFVAAVDGKLYVAGGNSGGPSPSSNVLERYDPLTDTWTTLAPLLTGRYQGGVAVLGTDIYVVGGWNPPSTFVPTNTVQIYDTLTNTWSFGPGMPILSSSGPTGVIDGKIYKHTAEHGFSSASRQLHVLDPNAGSWNARANLPNDHAGGVPGVVGGKLYIASGTDFGFGSGGGPHAQVHAYDPVSNTWSSLTTGPNPRQAVAGGQIGDHLLLAGGANPSGTTLSLFESYEVGSDTWSTLPSMPVAVNSAAGAVIGNKFYVVGGQSSGGVLQNSLYVFTIPEPSAAALWMCGVAWLVMRRRHFRPDGIRLVCE